MKWWTNLLKTLELVSVFVKRMLRDRDVIDAKKDFMISNKMTQVAVKVRKTRPTCKKKSYLLVGLNPPAGSSISLFHGRQGVAVPRFF